MSSYPDFRDPAVLRDQLRKEIAFFHPRSVDPAGGFYHYMEDDGRLYDAGRRHLVNSSRMVFCYALAYRMDPREEYRDAVRHGLRFLDEAHRQPAGTYAWVLQDGQVADNMQHCYGLAFVLLAQAHALRVGVEEARTQLHRTFARMEQLFWREQDGLYADEATVDDKVSSYRGQNANMHSCEALIAAYEATGEVRFLHRAERIAHNITQRQAAFGQGWIWEHYREDWTPDWDYNKDDPANMFRPWGFQPGHMTEWAKLLLLLERHGAHLQHGTEWLLPRSRELFDAAASRAWDGEHGGFVYGVAPDMRFCDTDKYFWVQAETLATAALLAQRTGEPQYWDWYEKTWRYSWDHMIDHQHGGWYRILRRDNAQYGLQRPPHGKSDFYHPMGALLESLHANEASLP